MINRKNFINRELSWLEFNVRVLEEAQDPTNPLFERLKFSSIVSSNMDEFFMVRVASLWDQVTVGFDQPDPAGLTPKEQIDKISKRAHEIVGDLYDSYQTTLLPRLKEEKVTFLKHTQLTKLQREFIKKYYWRNVYPVLTPMVVDQSRPFPLVLNKSLNIALLIDDPEDGEPIFATVQVPAVLSRYVEIPSIDECRYFILLEEIIKMYIHTLFRGHNIFTMGCYRITRSADLGLDEEGAEDLLEAIEVSIKKRRWGFVIRLEVEDGMAPYLTKLLIDEMEVSENEIFEIDGPLDLTFFMKFSSLEGFEHLKFEKLPPQPIPIFDQYDNIFSVIAKQDILLHHPYQSFNPVITMVQQAAVDPKVLAIKQALYRVSGNSPIVEALVQAAENGKQVTVLVELKARFDEANNINWAKRLEQAGCHVIYGLVGLKTHAKVLLVVRREEDGIKRYVHMGTGNYNDVTAKIYTDLGIFTANHYFGADISDLFNVLSGYSKLSTLYKVDIAPTGLKKKLISLIRQEAEHARNGSPGRIIAKMNSLVDEDIIQALYQASQAGVEIDLIVRGICCLRPGVSGVSENIRVRSIVWRFLEHSRIFYFNADGYDSIYISSADWMPRNLERRVELLAPVEDKSLRESVKEILDISLQDNEKARVLQLDGTYIRVERDEDTKPLNSQLCFYQQAMKDAKVKNYLEEIKEFQPIRSY